MTSYRRVPHRQEVEEGALELTAQTPAYPTSIIDTGRWSTISIDETFPDDTCVHQQSSAASLIPAQSQLGNDLVSEQQTEEVEDAFQGNSSVRQATQRREFKLLQKLSPWTFATLLASFVSALGAVAYLCFLWSFPNGTEKNREWVKIVLSGRVLISTTISAVVLRTAVTAQAM